MRRSAVNYLTDVLALALLVGMTATGLIIRYALPPGTGGQHGPNALTLWNLGRHQWGTIHFWIGCALGCVIVVHVALHWQWVCSVTARLIFRTPPGSQHRNVYGIVSLTVVVVSLLGFLALTLTSVERAASTRELQPSVATIIGSMTADELHDTHGVPHVALARLLDLPDGISCEDKLGRLCRRAGVSMHELRDRIMTYAENEVDSDDQ